MKQVDLDAAASFMAAHGRVLDRRRLQLLLGEGDASSGVVALDAYRNSDGGYGWALEPDLRSAGSQPVAAMHAFEVLAELTPTTTPHAVALCDWLDDHTLDDGGLPLALTISDPAGCAPVWVQADPAASSLQMTAQVAANAHLVARHHRAVAGHRWLARATRWCLDAIGAQASAPNAHELLFALRFLDAVADTEPDAVRLLESLGRFVPQDGVVRVEGGAEGEALRPLDFAPDPGRPVRNLFTAEAITADLERLAALQQSDGGWTVDFVSYSPAGRLDWRSYATVGAIAVLQANHSISPATAEEMRSP